MAGVDGSGGGNPRIADIGKVPPPTRDEVMYSLILEGTPDFDALTFEDWVVEVGYHHDSRAAEQPYRQCCDIGRKLRAGLGNDVINYLRAGYQDC